MLDLFFIFYKEAFAKKVIIFNNPDFNFIVKFSIGKWKFLKIRNRFLFFEENKKTPLILSFRKIIREHLLFDIIDDLKKTHLKVVIKGFDFYIISKDFKSINVLEYYWKFIDKNILIEFSYSFKNEENHEFIEKRVQKIQEILNTIELSK